MSNSNSRHMGFSTIYEGHVRNMVEYPPLAWRGTMSATLKKLDTIHDKAGHWASLNHPKHSFPLSPAANHYCVRYSKMHCSYLFGLLQQHLLSPQLYYQARQWHQSPHPDGNTRPLPRLLLGLYPENPPLMILCFLHQEDCSSKSQFTTV